MGGRVSALLKIKCTDCGSTFTVRVTASSPAMGASMSHAMQAQPNVNLIFSIYTRQ